MDAERIKRQMQEVAVGNYRAFISAADALRSVKEEVSSIHKHLDNLVILHNLVLYILSKVSSLMVPFDFVSLLSFPLLLRWGHCRM